MPWSRGTSFIILAVFCMLPAQGALSACPSGFFMHNEYCVQQALTCPPNYVLYNGMCYPAIRVHCSAGQCDINNQCCSANCISNCNQPEKCNCCSPPPAPAQFLAPTPAPAPAPCPYSSAPVAPLKSAVPYQYQPVATYSQTPQLAPPPAPCPNQPTPQFPSNGVMPSPAPCPYQPTAPLPLAQTVAPAPVPAPCPYQPTAPVATPAQTVAPAPVQAPCPYQSTAQTVAPAPVPAPCPYQPTAPVATPAQTVAPAPAPAPCSYQPVSPAPQTPCSVPPPPPVYVAPPAPVTSPPPVVIYVTPPPIRPEIITAPPPTPTTTTTLPPPPAKTTPYPSPVADPLTRCPDGTVFVGGVCRLIYCGRGIYKDGRCLQTECPEGTEWTGINCAPPQPIVHNIVYNNTVVTHFNHTQPPTVVNNVNNLMINASVAIDETYNANEERPTTVIEVTPTPVDEEDVYEEVEKSPKCCTVVTPRTCAPAENSDRYKCYSNRYRRCGSMCVAPTIYLKAPEPRQTMQYVVMPPNPVFSQCQMQGGCPQPENRFDCSGCARNMPQHCSSYCYSSPCSSHSCQYYDQVSYCSQNPGQYGCTQQDGCLDKWCGGY